MRISDWSSDVCSSDLVDRHFAFEGDGGPSQAFGYRFDIAKQAGEPPDFAGLVLFAALDDQVVGVAAGDDFLPVVGRDRKSVGSGKSVLVRVALGGRRISKKKQTESTRTSV